MSRFFPSRRIPPRRQRVFAFLERARRRRRWFKWSLSIATVLIVAGLLAAVPRGWYLAVALADKARQSAWKAVGVPPRREDIDAQWRRFRRQGIEQGYQQRKEELGLNHFEGRSWHGFHHHACLVMLAYGFLALEQLRAKQEAPVQPGKNGKAARGSPCQRSAARCSSC